MSGSSRSVSSESARVPSVVASASSLSVFSENATALPSVDISTSVSSESARVSSFVSSASSQSVFWENANHRVPVQVFEGDENMVVCVRFYPDENKLVSGSRDGTLRIWDRKTGAVLEVLSGHTTTVCDVDVSQDGKMVVSGSHDKTIRIWDGESGEAMHVFEGHEDGVWSVEFSRDSTRVMSGSWDGTVQVLSVETGERAFEPIQCHDSVRCVRYSPSGDRIASGTSGLQIWDAATGSGILSIRRDLSEVALVTSLVWTADSNHIIGDCGDTYITLWDSHNGDQLRTWKAYDHANMITTFSLSPTGTHLVTSNWLEKRAFVFDISTGEQVAVFKHARRSHGIAYSPSGKYIATGCRDTKVYVWEAPAFEDPLTKAQKSRPPSFSWLLDRPAIPLAGPSRNNGRGFYGFEDGLPNRDQGASLPLQRIFNKIKGTLTNLFTRRSAGAAQTSPVRETIEPVEVAAGRDRVFWIIILPIVWTPVKKLVYMLFFCRKPEEEEEEVPANTAANSSKAVAGDAATSKQSEHTQTVDGAGNVVAGPNSPSAPPRNPSIRTQPERTAAMRLSSAEDRGTSESFPPESIEMLSRGRQSSIQLAISLNPTVPAYASAQPTSSVNPLPPAPCEISSSTVVVASGRLSVSSNSAHPPSTQSSSQYMEVRSAVTLSPEEMALVQEYRRLKDASVAVRMAEPLSGPAHNHESYVHREPPIPSRQSRSVTPSTSSAPHPSSPEAWPRMHAAGFHVLDVAPVLLPPSRHSIHQPSTSADMQPLDLTAVSTDDALVETPLVSASQPTALHPTNTEERDGAFCEEMHEIESEIPYYGA